MLGGLSGKWHQVMTAVALVDASGKQAPWVAVENRSKVPRVKPGRYCCLSSNRGIHGQSWRLWDTRIWSTFGRTNRRMLF